MKINDVAAIYPSFVMRGHLDEFSAKDNRVLADLAWENSRENVRSTSNVRDSAELYSRNPFQNLIEKNRNNEIVRRFAGAMDSAAREYLSQVYKFSCTWPIELFSDAFCQNKDTGTHGMWVHTHIRKPIIVAYYPVVNLQVRGNSTTSMGVDGQANFYDPNNYGRRPFPNHNPAFHCSSVYRAVVRSGDFLVFEGYVPHDSAPFEGTERVCIATACDIKTPISVSGIQLESL